MKIAFSIPVFLLIAFYSMQAQNSVLINKTFISKIGYVCEETTDDNPCAGLQVYLVLAFSDKQVSITEKEISSCGSEYISYKFDYKWELTEKNEIKIYSNSKEIEDSYLKDLALNIENEKVVGYKQRNIINDRIEFQEIEKK